uniref:Alpha-L-Rha alpha-1,3-L-rhamnosyltransferase n=1 Tax=Loigolactobacillus rennini TaxID=238013 RepID=A0A1K2I9Z8_9LACO|nr:Alpha-L-Rha alpha-1,3-L-rhamnosyltransferase [Loigolactobacillus rennini]
MKTSEKEIINILLSTYNGSQYLEELITSVLKQECVTVHLFIRDDGSTDKTKAILNKYRNLNEIQIEFGENIGWRRSFMKLIQKVPYQKEQFYAFADQDDVWEPLKIMHAIEKLDTSKPAVYHSNMTLVDNQMNFISYKYDKDFLPSSKIPNAFFDGIGTGATMVFNSKMLKLLQQYTPTAATAHDAYVLALANLVGKTVYDSNSYILYRRHNNTATGFGGNKVSKSPSLLMRFKRYRRSMKRPYSIRAYQILQGYKNILDESDRNILKYISNYRSNIYDKFYLLFSPKIRATGLRQTLQIKYRIFFNTL